MSIFADVRVQASLDGATTHEVGAPRPMPVADVSVAAAVAAAEPPVAAAAPGPAVARATLIDAVRAEIDHAIRQGQLIMAIKRYREVMNVGLREAKDAIDAWPRTAAPVVEAPPPPSDALRTEITTCLRQGQKIMAIKRYRELTGVGLKEAKDVIDAWPG